MVGNQLFCEVRYILLMHLPYIKNKLAVRLLKIACPEVYLRVHFWTRGDVSKVGYFFDIPASLKLSLYTVMT